jgi:type IV fimbrial biogenesis protein FimT
MLKPNPLPRVVASGFTLIEVLVVLTISAILLAVGVPMFNGSIARARASDAANTLLSALELARSEAIRRGINSTVCRVVDPAAPACSNAAAGNFVAGDWAAGWAVFAENNQPAGTDGVIDAGDLIVLVQDRFPTGGALRAEILGAGNIGAITFRPDGVRVGGVGVTFAVTYPQPAAGAAIATRNVNVTALGHVTVRP